MIVQRDHARTRRPAHSHVKSQAAQRITDLFLQKNHGQGHGRESTSVDPGLTVVADTQGPGLAVIVVVVHDLVHAATTANAPPDMTMMTMMMVGQEVDMSDTAVDLPCHTDVGILVIGRILRQAGASECLV